MKQRGWALEYASDELFGDREIMIMAVRQNWNALQYADQDIKKDRYADEVFSDGKILQWT